MTRRTFVLQPLSAAGALALLPAVQPCYAGKVQVYLGKGVDMSTYKTYEWLPPKRLAKSGLLEGDPEFTPLIKAAVNKHLIARGLKEVPSGGDLQVATLGLSESVPQLEAMIFPGYYVDSDFGTGYTGIGRYNKEGTLVVNLIDTKTKRSAWAGLARETLKSGEGSGREKIDKAANRIFEKYPLKKMR